MVPVISGVIMNGIAKIGLSMIGMPKITGSLMLKKPGPIDSLAISFISLRREAIITAISRQMVQPEPPILIYTSQNGIVMMFGTSWPCSNAVMLTMIAPNSSGSRIGLIIWLPWIPITQNSWATNISSRIPGRLCITDSSGRWITSYTASYKYMPVTRWKTKPKVAMIITVIMAGINAEKDAETFGGTLSGILIRRRLTFSSAE